MNIKELTEIMSKRYHPLFFDTSQRKYKDGDDYQNIIPPPTRRYLGVRPPPPSNELVLFAAQNAVDLKLREEYQLEIKKYLLRKRGSKFISHLCFYKEILRNSTPLEKALKELYKILTIYRNKLVHTSYEIDYVIEPSGDDKKHWCFVYDDDENWVARVSGRFFEICYFLLDQYLEQSFSLAYVESIFAWFYPTLVQSVKINLNSELGKRWGEFSDVTFEVKALSSNNRIQLYCDDYQIENDEIRLCYPISDVEIECRIQVDFCFEYKGEEYQVPKEALVNDRVCLDQLDQWAVVKAIGITKKLLSVRNSS